MRPPPASPPHLAKHAGPNRRAHITASVARRLPAVGTTPRRPRRVGEVQVVVLARELEEVVPLEGEADADRGRVEVQRAVRQAPRAPHDVQLDVQLRELDKFKDAGDYRTVLLKGCTQMRETALKHLKAAQARYKNYYDRRSKPIDFTVGQLVCKRVIPKPHKLQKRWSEPKKVLEKLGSVTYKIETGPGEHEVVHANNLKPFYDRSK